MKLLKKLCAFVLAAVLLSLNSCIGVRSDIQFRADGSGTINLEYRYAKAMEALGKLDGNERRPLLPAGRADFERTAARVEGLKLLSFSSREDEKDTIYQAGMSFADLESLVRFLDAQGQRALIKKENGKTVLNLTLANGQENPDPDLAALVTSLAQGYRFEMTFSVPSGGIDLRLIPGEAIPGAELVSGSGKASFSAPIANLLTDTRNLGIEISF
ncbi:MAG: hypothetical protein LBP76_07170 [Treponema sp.]|jgi:hypothetical protein|nr:hypothetical protein [Treponema sp.]